MNLVSCEKCGVVLDKDRLDFPEDITNEDGSVNLDKALWDGRDYVQYVDCPVCVIGSILNTQ